MLLRIIFRTFSDWKFYKQFRDMMGLYAFGNVYKLLIFFSWSSLGFVNVFLFSALEEWVQKYQCMDKYMCLCFLYDESEVSVTVMWILRSYPVDFYLKNKNTFRQSHYKWPFKNDFSEWETEHSVDTDGCKQCWGEIHSS